MMAWAVQQAASGETPGLWAWVAMVLFAWWVVPKRRRRRHGHGHGGSR